MNQNQTQKTHLTQQVFHKALFETRQRSSSFSGCSGSTMPLETPESGPKKTKSGSKQYETTEKANTSENLTLQKQPGDDDNQTWQQDHVPHGKRKRHESPTNSNKQSIAKRTNFSVPVHNKFDILSIDDQTGENRNKEYIPKPEPIFVTGVIDITPLRDVLNKVVCADKYTLTTLRSGHIIKLMPIDIATYKVVRDTLIEKKINHYTYKLKSERAYRVVIRGMHATEDLSSIKSELLAKGHEVRQIVNVQHRSTKEKLPLFFVDIEQRPNNKEIFNIKQISHLKVTIEAPYKKKEVLQCKRCQRFGHTKNQCFRPFRCVKCGNDHPTSTCTKPPETDAICANCQGKHPASYRGCLKYKEYKERILKIKPKLDINQVKSKSTTVNPQLKGSEEPRSTHQPRSYSDALKTKTKETTERHFNLRPATQTHDVTIEQGQNITNLLDVMFNRFQTIMSEMMNSMMDRMIQLITGLVPQRP